MRAYEASRAAAVLMAVTQLLGPATLWAAESPRSPKADAARRVVLSGVQGEVWIAPADTAKEPKPARFHDVLSYGDQIRTGAGSVAEVLVGRHALVTLHEDSTVHLVEEGPGQRTVQVLTGEVRLAVARTEDTVTVHTPTATAVTRGGLIHIKVMPAKRQAGHVSPDHRGRAMPIALAPVIPTAVTPAQTAPTETFQVNEGAIQIKSSAPGAPLTTVGAGQSVQVAAGQIGKVSSTQALAAGTYSLPAADSHARTSEAGIRYLASQQQQQAAALQHVLLGPSDVERSVIRNAATGAILATNDVIISTTGPTLAGTLSGDLTQSPPLDYLFAPGGLFNTGRLMSPPASATGIAEDTTIQDISVQPGTSNGTTFSVRGGGGLVVFDKHTIQAKSELVYVDSGNTRLAPHNGTPPSATIYVTPSVLLPSPSADTPRPHTGLPLQFPNVLTIGGGTAAANLNRNAEVFIQTNGNSITDLEQYSRENGIQGGLSGSNNVLGNILVARTTVDRNGNFTGFSNPAIVGLAPNERESSLVDGVVRARSGITGNRTVVLEGGVILNQTKLTASFAQDPPSNPALPAALQPPPNATRQYFTETGQSSTVNGSIIGIVAKKDSTGTLRPAFATMLDRAFAVLDGSTLAPATPETRIGLLSVLDSQLTGPRTIPSTRTSSDGQPGVPPLIEIINSNPPLSNPTTAGVQATSAVVVRATGALNGVLPVDRALLEATSPLVVMVNSTMTTTGHFADLSGTAPSNSRGLLSANLVPGDALVRLDASTLTVMGNFLNLANGATASITGHLFSLTNGSTLTVNGVLVNLAGNSTLTLNSTAFGVFGPGANTLNINNNLCAGGCSAVPGFPALRVAGGGNVTLPSGFTPFAVAPGAPSPQVNIAPTAAVFQVSPQAQMNVTVRQ